MAASVPKELPQIVELFKLIGEREEIRQLQETAIAAQEEALQAQLQEVQDLRDEKQALEAVIAQLESQLTDLTSAIPSAAQVVELRLTETRQAVADEAEQLRRIQAYQQSIKQQIADQEQVLANLKSDIMGLGRQAGARAQMLTAPTLAPGVPTIISAAPTIPDDDSLDEPSEEAAL